MGWATRASAVARVARGDDVTVIGSDPAKAVPGARFRCADLSSVTEVRRVAGEITGPVDALLLFANRPQPARRETSDGLEYTFALYYLSRYLLGQLMAPQLDAAPHPLIVNVAGVGTRSGRIRWDDLQLTGKYSLIRAQLQVGRANDLLGVAHAARHHRARYVLYHPGFTRSGLDGHPSPIVRAVLRTMARFFAHPVAESVRPIVDWVDEPPPAPLTAVDRGAELPLTFPTLDPADAARLDRATSDLLARLPV
jgi:hypothetical protein